MVGQQPREPAHDAQVEAVQAVGVALCQKDAHPGDDTGQRRHRGQYDQHEPAGDALQHPQQSRAGRRLAR